MNFDKLYYRGYLKINLDVIYHNVCCVKNLLQTHTKIIAVVKADAYGLGMLPIARKIKSIVDAYAVATIDEALVLKKEIKNVPIYVLGFIPSDRIEEAIGDEIRMTVFEFSQAVCISEYAKRLNKKAYIHIKVDTGMGRIGFIDNIKSINDICNISRLDNINIEGIFTHFARSDEENKSYTEIQLERFNAFVKGLEAEQIYIPIKHCCNSAAIIRYSDAHCDAVRMGIVLYGMYPSDIIEKKNIGIESPLEWKSHIVYIKEVEKGVSISYGGTYITNCKTKVATVPIGYADGYPRILSNKGYVLVKGKRAPIIGRICMDQFMIDVTNIDDAKEGDSVILLGRELNEQITVEELANNSNTINYEIVCDISKRMPRVYYQGGKIVEHVNFFY